MMMRMTDTVKHLLIINGLMFAGTFFIGQEELFFQWFGLFFPENSFFRPWQLLTHMFMHVNFSHLLSNMILLFFFGTMLESYLGKKKFIFLYISAGIGAGIIPILIDYISYNSLMNILIENGLSREEIVSLYEVGKYNTGWELILGEDNMDKFTNLIFRKVSLGASGAAMGVLAACGFLFPNATLILIFPPIPIKMKYLVVGLIGSDLISAILTGTPLLAGSKIGYLAHVSGAFVGFVMVYIWKKNQFDKYRLS